MPIDTKAIEYRDGHSDHTGLLAWDNSHDGKRPGILLVHGGAGVDDHAKGRARLLARSGFVVFACDMYGDGVAGNRRRVFDQISELRRDPEIMSRRARSGLAVLASQTLVDGRFAAVGYCFGGMVVLELARSGFELAGVVSVHGSLDTSQRAQPKSVKAKILVCHGALDPHVPMGQLTAFAEEMNHAGADWQLTIYGGAMHGFTHDKGPQLPGVQYHLQTDIRSSDAMQNFFAELFRNDRKCLPMD